MVFLVVCVCMRGCVYVGGVGGGCKVSSMQNRLSFALFRLFKALLGKS